MAITVLSYPTPHAQSGVTTNASITLPAGTNRRLFVCIQSETDPRVSSVSYGGQALALVTDGSVTAQAFIDDGANDQEVTIWQLLEANMPANGSQTLSTTFSASSTLASIHFVLLEGCDQSTNVLDSVINAATGTGDPKTLSLISPGTGGAVVGIAGCGNNTNYTMTYNGAAPSSSQELDTGATTTGRAAVWLSPAAGTLTMSADSSAAVNRQVLAGISVEEAATVNTSTMALTGVPITGSGTGTVSWPTGPAIEFVDIATGGSPLSFPVIAGSGRLLVVAVTRVSDIGSGATATYGGVAMQIANNSNGWSQTFYMLDPPVGTADIVVSGGSLSIIIVTEWHNIVAFQEGAQGSQQSFTFDTDVPALLTFSMASAGAATPLTNVTERHDAAGDYYGDMVTDDGGTFTVGTSGATDPDASAAVFLGNIIDAGDNTATMDLTGVPVEGSGTGVAKLTSTLALTAVPVAGTGSGQAKLTSTQALTGVPIEGTGTGVAKLTSTLALTSVPIAGAGSGQAKLTGTLALTSVPVAGTGSGEAKLTGTLSLTGAPVAGSGTGVAKLTGTLDLTSVPVAGAGTGDAKLTSTQALLGVPIEGSGTGSVIPVSTLALVGVPVQGTGTGEAKLTSTMALVGAAVAGAGTGVAALLATQALTGVPVAGSGTGAAALQSTQALTGVPVAGSGTGAARLTATMDLVGPAIQGEGTGSVPSVAGLNLTGVPVQGSGTGVAKLTSTFQLSGVPIAGSGTGSAKLTAQLDLTSVPVAGNGTGAAKLESALELLGVPVEGAGTGAARLLSSLGLAGVPITGSGSGAVALRATMELRGVPIIGSGTGEGGSPTFVATMDLIGVAIVGSGTGVVGLAPTGQTQAQEGADLSMVVVVDTTTHAEPGAQGERVVLAAQQGATVVIVVDVTSVKVG